MPGKVKLILKQLIIAVLLVKAAPAFAAAPPKINYIDAAGPEVALYEKFELRISLDATFTNPFTH